MTGLTSLGTLHTAIGLVAVISGLVAFYKYKEISPHTSPGRLYLWTTLATCLSGFGIFQHGGFGPPHALGVLTLLVLALATVADKTLLFGRLSAYVVTIAYSLSFFFHTIPGTTETFTRLPTESPLFSSPEDPALKATISVFFLIFLVGVTLQVRRLMSKGQERGAPVPTRS